MSNKTNELTFQTDVIKQLLANGWQLGTSQNYNRELALYPEDLLDFIQATQPEQWQKFCALYPNNTEQKLLENVAAQLNKTDPNAANKELRTFGTLGVLRHEIKDRNTRFSLCQFKPEHELNPDTLARYQQNRFRVVPELVYSPYATAAQLKETGTKAKAWRIDLVLFLNGIPIAALANICKPAVERWQKRYQLATEAYEQAKNIFERAKKSKDAVLIANAKNSLTDCKKAKDVLEIFKKDLGTFSRFYEFMSQIVNYDDKELEKLNLYAKNLRPMLRENLMEDDIDLSNVVLSHYRLSKLYQQDLKLKPDETSPLDPMDDLGTAQPKDRQEEFISEIIRRLNAIFDIEKLTEADMVNYAYTIRDKVRENTLVMKQIMINSPEQAMLGDFPKALEKAVMDSGEAHQNQMMQLLSDPTKATNFAKVVFDLLTLSGTK